MAAEYSTSMGHWRNGTDGGNRSTRKEYELHHPLVLVTNNPVHSHNTWTLFTFSLLPSSCRKTQVQIGKIMQKVKSFL